MNTAPNQLFDKAVHTITVIFLLSLAYSEALKSISLVLMAVFLVYAVSTKRCSITQDRINAVITLHVLVVIVGIWTGINPDESIKQFSDVVKILLVFLFFREIDLKYLSVEKILNFLFYGFVFALSVGVYMYYFQEAQHLKLRSVGSVNRSIVYTVLILMLALPFAYSENKFSTIWKVVSGMAIMGIIIAGSRMALFSLPILLLIFLYLRGRLTIKHIMIITGLSVSFLILVQEFFPGTYLSSRIHQGFSDPVRIQLWVSAIKYFIESCNQSFGIGVGNSMLIDIEAYYDYWNPRWPTTLDNTHQVYLDMLIERGFLGLATFITFIGLIMKRSWSRLKEYPIHLSVFLMSSSILLMGLANITFRYEFALLFVCIAGLSFNKALISKTY